MAKLQIPLRAHIEASPQKVFDYIADLTKHPEWATNPLKIESVSGGQVGVGSKYRSEAVFMKKDVSAEQEVTVYEPPTRFGFASNEGGQVYTHAYAVRPEGTGTLLERTITTDVPGPRGIMMKLMVGMAAPGLTKRNVQKLKERLEG